MRKEDERCNRKSTQGNGTWFSDEVLFAVTRGLAARPRRRDSGRPVSPAGGGFMRRLAAVLKRVFQ